MASSRRAPDNAVAGSSWETSTCCPSPVRPRWMTPGQDGDGPEIAAHVVEVGERPPRRGPVGQAHQEGEPGQGLGGGAHGHVGGVGALVSEPAHRHVDDVGTDLPHDVVGEAPAIERARREALGHDVGVRHEVLQQRQALGVAGVHGDAPLPARVVLVEDPAAVGARRPGGVGECGGSERLTPLAGLGDEGRHDPDGVGEAGALDPDDLGPQAPADQGGLGPEAEAGEVEDAQALERHGRQPRRRQRPRRPRRAPSPRTCGVTAPTIQ